MSALLQVDSIQTYIGQYHILQGVSLDIPQGGCTVLLGRNGAGKTTTLKTIIGLLHPRDGAVIFKGEAIHKLAPHAVARKGIAYVPEDRGVFTDLTVEENLRLALPRGRRLEAKKEFLLSIFPDLAKMWRWKGGQLSGGQQQMLVISRALVSDSELILLDEPSKGLAPLLVQQVGQALVKLKSQVTLLLVEQNLALAAAVADRYYILDDGRSVHSGNMPDLMADKELQARYLGLGSKGVA
jgi:branched-chain amino acid transport system ATP-binding protein